MGTGVRQRVDEAAAAPPTVGDLAVGSDRSRRTVVHFWSQHKSQVEHNSLAAQEKYLQQEKSRLSDLQKQLKQGASEEEKQTWSMKWKI